LPVDVAQTIAFPVNVGTGKALTVTAFTVGEAAVHPVPFV
jgi:hypothetical protein